MKRVGIGLGIFVVVLFVLGTFVLPPLFRPVVESAAAAKGVDMEIDSLRVGVLRGTVGLGGLVVANPSGFTGETLASVDACRVNARLWPLLRREIVVQSIRVDGPEMFLERAASGAINVTTLLDQVAGPAQAPSEEPGDTVPEDEPAAAAAPFHVGKVTIDDMKVEWTDYTVPGPGHVALDDVRLTVEELYSPMPADTMDTQVNIRGRMGGDAQGTFGAAGQGNFLSEALDFDVTVTLDQVTLTAFQAYTAKSPVVPAGGTISGTIEATCRRNQLEAVGKLHLAGLALKSNEEANAVMRLPAGVMSGIGNLDPEHDVEVRVSGDVRDPNFHVLSALLFTAFTDILDLGADTADALKALATSATDSQTWDQAADTGSTAIEKAEEAVGSLFDRLKRK